MKITCNACETEEAKVLCCADEAALCLACDEKIHAANKLASKHQRVLLTDSSSSQMPKCDVCKESIGYFFCLEDRALLCRKCDYSIHTANSLVSAHQRFLLTGVKVGLESVQPVVPSSKLKPNSPGRTLKATSQSVPRKRNLNVLAAEPNELVPNIQVDADGGLPTSKVSFSEASTNGSIDHWPSDEFLGLTDFNEGYGVAGLGPSKVCDRNQGDLDWSPILRATYEEVVDERSSEVPQVPWIHTANPSTCLESGLFWQNNIQNTSTNSAVFVPDICYSSLQYDKQFNPKGTIMKRQRL